MDTQIEVKPEEKQLQVEGPRIIVEATEFKVVDDLTCEQAIEKANTVKGKLDWAVKFFKPMKDAAHAAHKAICDREKAITEPYEQAKKIYIQKGADYTAKKQAEQDEKERRAKEEAERKEREERARLEKETREKEAEEAKKRAEAQKALDAAKKAAKEGDEKKVAEALAKADKAREEAEAAERKAESLREEKENVYVAPRAVTQAAKPTGMSVQMVWVPEVVDEKKVPVKWYTEIDLGRLKRAKTADPTLEVPGIRFVKKAQGAALGARS